MDFKDYYQQQYAAYHFYQDFTKGDTATSDICDLLIMAIREYLDYNKAGNFSDAELALEGSSTYVACDLSEEEFETYVESFEGYISAALDGCYDDDIDFENGIAFEDEVEAA